MTIFEWKKRRREEKKRAWLPPPKKKVHFAPKKGGNQCLELDESPDTRRIDVAKHQRTHAVSAHAITAEQLDLVAPLASLELALLFSRTNMRQICAIWAENLRF